MIETIDFNNMLKETKKRISLDYKQIKKMSLYNFLNDNVRNIIIDCRSEYESKQNIEGGKLRDSFNIDLNLTGYESKENSRLILIIDNEKNLKTDEDLSVIRKFIENEEKIEKGIFVIFDSDYQKFVKDFDFFLLNDDSNDLKLQLSKTNFPLMILDNLLYTGNFLNSKNFHQINNLRIGSIISLLNEEDIELKKNFKNSYFIEANEQTHSEIDFLDIIDSIEIEIEKKNTPILIYCFSGQSISLAVCIAFLMKSKKWSIEFATGFIGAPRFGKKMETHPLAFLSR